MYIAYRGRNLIGPARSYTALLPWRAMKVGLRAKWSPGPAPADRVYQVTVVKQYTTYRLRKEHLPCEDLVEEICHVILDSWKSILGECGSV